ncbi:MAG: bacillithiol biosynthesis deacetylase BshB1 [bacterium]|nr:bacillithiol biosynthesis deacetylase BshB1 [bacterium]
MKVDILVFSPHPDDAELGVGGLLIKMKGFGYTTGIIDLTRGEMGSYGTPEIRKEEAWKAKELLNLDTREIIDLGDCKIEDNYKNRIIISNLIRKYKPRIVLTPFVEDRHPDHITTGTLVKNSNIYCRLKNLKSDYSPHAPKLFLFYPLQSCIKPTLVVDITEVFEKKLDVIKVYRSQFERSNQDISPIGIRDYLFHIESRNRFYGSLINVKYGEAFIVETSLNIKDPFVLV